MVDCDEQLDHGPVLAALGLLRFDQVRHAEVKGNGVKGNGVRSVKGNGVRSVLLTYQIRFEEPRGMARPLRILAAGGWARGRSRRRAPLLHDSSGV